MVSQQKTPISPTSVHCGKETEIVRKQQTCWHSYTSMSQVCKVDGVYCYMSGCSKCGYRAQRRVGILGFLYNIFGLS